MLTNSVNLPKGWLAFELNILRRLEFRSVSIPYTNKPNLGMHLKRWNIKVLANDLLESAFADATAQIENNNETLSEEDVGIILNDAYMPRYRLENKALTNWFSETDAWWFDNIRKHIHKLSSPLKKAVALHVGMNVGDYVLSFDEATSELRQPLSQAFKRFWNIMSKPVNNGQKNTCQNKNAIEFTAENYTDLFFLRLPCARSQTLKEYFGKAAWREEWVRGSDSFWNELENSQRESLGARIATKSQYLNLVDDMLKTASHVPLWAIEHVEDGFVKTQDIVDVVSEVRRVETIFSKDFSEFLGIKAAIITA